MENSIYKWMMTGGSPISGNPHITSFDLTKTPGKGRRLQVALDNGTIVFSGDNLMRLRAASYSWIVIIIIIIIITKFKQYYLCTYDIYIYVYIYILCVCVLCALRMF